MYKALSVAYYIGMILIFAAILLQLNGLTYAFTCLVVGLVPFLGVRLFNYMYGKPENKRLNGIMVVSALFLTIAAGAIYMGRNYWIIAVLITGTLDFYVSFRKFRP